MDIMHHSAGSVLVVAVPKGTGGLAGEDIDLFIDAVCGMITPPIKTVGLDMAQRDYLNSTGLSELIRLKDILMDRGVELALFNISPRVTSLITVVGVDRFVTVVRDEDELLQR